MARLASFIQGSNAAHLRLFENGRMTWLEAGRLGLRPEDLAGNR
jgi:hypothetical protein